MSTEARLSTEEVFYGKSEPTPGDTPPGDAAGKAAQQPTEEKPKGEGEEPAPKKSFEDAMYGESRTKEFEGTIGYDADQLSSVLQLPPEERTALVKETGEIFHALGVSASDAQPFFSLYKSTVLHPPSEEQSEKWGQEGLLQANERYGYQETQRRLNKVNAYLRAPGNETLRNELIVTRLGNHPKVIAAFLERADRFKVPKG